MLDPATDVDLVAGASVSVANFSDCQYFSCQCLWLPVPLLPVSLAASISCQFLWLPVPQLPESRLPGASVTSASASVAGTSVSVARVSAACNYVYCWCLCISCWCLLVPWLVSRFCAMVAEDITKPVAEDRRLSKIHMSHQHRCPVSRPSSPQTTTDQVICNTKNVMKI